MPAVGCWRVFWAGCSSCERLTSDVSDLQAPLTAGCTLPQTGYLGFALKPSDSRCVTSSGEGREALGWVIRLGDCNTRFWPRTQEIFKT